MMRWAWSSEPFDLQDAGDGARPEAQRRSRSNAEEKQEIARVASSPQSREQAIRPDQKWKTWGEVKPEPGSIYYKEGGDYPTPAEVLQGGDQRRTRARRRMEGRPAPKGRADSREMARGLFCSVHQFRHAYALCAYCHRPFCFEDIVEYQKDYYCIEDIDRVTARYTEKLTNEYSISSLITSFIMIGGFVLFFYYSNGQLGYMFTYILEQSAWLPRLY